jgi:RNA recognition motif-containing protein
MRESVERETGGFGGSARANSGKKKGFFHHLDQITTSFFITNLPDDASIGDLWKTFREFGRVGEVYIPKKLDRRGRRFGFVKFKEVEDVEALGDRLKDVWIGPYKLWVNRSRFERSERK